MSKHPSRKISIGGREYDVIEEDFETNREEWNEYRLTSGGKVKIKVIVGRIYRVLDESGKPAFTKNGDPHLIVQHRTEILGS